jgi:deazaflavin-dependent oxidoreductase (nitroreductase family)
MWEMAIDAVIGEEDYCYLTTVGRRSGRPHTIEIWFALDGDTLYMLAGGGDRADWVRNLRRAPAVTVRIGDVTFDGWARIVTDGEEDARARAIVVAKYRPRYRGDLTDWGQTALPVAVDLVTPLDPARRPL